MSTKDVGKQTGVHNAMKENKQLYFIVNGCKVKLNFPAKPESSAVNDIKRMMLGGVVKP